MALLGSQLPDLDTTTSTIGQICFPLSNWLEDNFPHRSITHSLLATAVLAAIAAPSLLGLMNRTRVKEGIAQIEGAIKEGQRQAIRTGKICTVNIDNPSTGYNYVRGACILSERKLPTNAKIATNDTSISFSSKGTPDNGAGSVYVVYMENGTNEQRCLVVNPGLGIMRTGEYDGDPTGTLNVDNCIALP